MRALRRCFPSIYTSEQKLLLDPARVSVERQDFMAAFSSIVPASHRSAAAQARFDIFLIPTESFTWLRSLSRESKRLKGLFCRPLPDVVAPVLQRHLTEIVASLRHSFPPAAACLSPEVSEENRCLGNGMQNILRCFNSGFVAALASSNIAFVKVGHLGRSLRQQRRSSLDLGCFSVARKAPGRVTSPPRFYTL